MTKQTQTAEQQVKHTPGPWVACANGGDDTNRAICYVTTTAHQASTTIADCSYPFEVAEQEANARLISAAPELLNQLQQAEQLLARLNYAFYAHGTSKALKPVMAETKPTLTAIRTLIAKARGKG